MNYVGELLNNYLVDAFGWTLIHSIWQITLWALVAVTVLIFTHKRKANIRYILLSLILVGVCATSVITFKKYAAITEVASFQSERYETPVTNESGQNLIAASEVYAANDNGTLARWRILCWFRDYFTANMPAIISIWFLGFVFLFLRYLGSFAWLMRLKGSYESASEEFQNLIYKLCRKLNMKKIVDIGTSIRINNPISLGHFKPVILLPARLLTGLTNEQLETILLHELAHIKRNDFIVNLFQSLIEIVFFYHPAIWWLSSAIRTEREHACDDLAVKGGANALSLAQTLADLAGYFTSRPEFSHAFSGKQHKIKNRIHRLILNEKMNKNLNTKVIVATGIILSVATLSFSVKKDVTTNSANKQETVLANPILVPIVAENNQIEGVDPAQKISLPIENKNDVLNNSIQDDTIKSGDDANESMAQTLMTLLGKGAKEWNKYRSEHPGENFDMALKESNLSGFDLSNFNLVAINLKEAKLINTNFTNANMTGVNIKEADVKGAIFEKADLSNSDMKELFMDGNNLKNAVLRGANLKEITLINCDLSGADLTGCNLSEATIENCTFKGALANHTTLFPPGFNWSEQGIEFK